MELRAGGQLVAVGSIDGLRAEFGRRLSQARDVVPMLEGIKREIADVKTGYQENLAARKLLRRFGQFGPPHVGCYTQTRLLGPNIS